MQKDIDYRLNELKQATRALEIAIPGFIESRDEAYLLGVKSTLRALVATGGSSFTPLLIDMSEHLQIPLTFYSIPPKPDTPAANLVSSLRAYKDWSVQPRPGMQIFVLKDWLTCRAFFVDGTHTFATRNDVLRQISESEGGAHYDLKIKQIVDSLRRSVGSNYDGAQFFLVNLGALVFWLGRRLLLVEECRRNTIDVSTDSSVRELDSYFDSLEISML